MKLNVTQFITAELANPHDKENWEWISSEYLNTVFSSASSFYLVNLSFFSEVKVLGYCMIIGVLKENLGCPGGSDCKESDARTGLKAPNFTGVKEASCGGQKFTMWIQGC